MLVTVLILIAITIRSFKRRSFSPRPHFPYHTGAAGGDTKSVKALQEELQELRDSKDPKAYFGAVNTQLMLDSNASNKLPNLSLDYNQGNPQLWSIDETTSKSFAEDSNGGIAASGEKAYPPVPGSMPFDYRNGTSRLEWTLSEYQNPAVANLEYLATGAQDGNQLDATKLQAQLQKLAASDPSAIDHLNDQLANTTKADGVFDLPTFFVNKIGSKTEMDVWYPYDGRQFSENSTGKTYSGTVKPLPDEGCCDDPLDVKPLLPVYNFRPTDERGVSKY